MDKAKKRLLFICLGNICRSPAAHGIMQHLVDERGLSADFHIDSAGIGGWHSGELPDRRMREHASRRGFQLTHRARQFASSSDFGNFDLILTMDADNFRAVTHLAQTSAERGKVRRMTDFLHKYAGETSVPDPYYGGPRDFEWALDLLEDACRGLLDELLGKEQI